MERAVAVAAVVFALLLGVAVPAGAQGASGAPPMLGGDDLAGVGLVESDDVPEESAFELPAGSTQRTFTARDGTLTLAFLAPANLAEQQMFELWAGLCDVLGPFEVPGQRARGCSLSAHPDGSGLDLVVFSDGESVFMATLTSLPGARWDPHDVLRGVVGRQVELSRTGSAPIDTTPRPVDDELAALLPAVPEGWTGQVMNLGSGAEDLRGAVASFLDRNTASAALLLSPAGDLGAQDAYVALVTRYPEGLFAAAAMGSGLDDVQDAIVAREHNPGLGRIASTTGTGDQLGSDATLFRRGPYVFAVHSTARNDVAPELVEARRLALVRAFAAKAPSGPDTPYFFPTALATAAVTVVLVTGGALAVISVSRLRARRATSSRARVRSGCDRAREQAVGAGAVGAGAVVAGDGGAGDVGARNVGARDVAGPVRSMHRRGRALLGAQLLCLNLVALGLVLDIGRLGYVVAAVGLVAGVVLTAAFRRAEAPGTDGARWHRSLRLRGVVPAVLALGLIAVAGAAAGRGLGGVAGAPSLSLLKLADALGTTHGRLAAALALAGGVCLVVGAAAYRSARRRGRASARQLLVLDRRRPILYLRSFEDDELELATVLSPRRPFLEMFSLRGREPFEEAVAWQLSWHGPVVAIGRQDRPLASLGAAREHVADDQWRDRVIEHLGTAAAVVVTVGSTPGLEWEIETIVRLGHLGRTIFLFPPVDDEALASRWATVWQVVARVVGDAPRLRAEPSRTVTVVASAVGWTALTSDRRDEASYRAAVDASFAALLPPPPVPVPAGAAPAPV